MPETDIVDNPATSTQQNWFDGVSETNQALVAKKNWATLDVALDSYTALEKGMGDRVKLPTAETPAEEVSAFYQKLGRPQTAADYTLPVLPEGKKYDEGLLGGMKAVAFEAGITDSQFSKFIEKYLAIEAQRAEEALAEYTREKDANEKAMQEKHGGEYDKFLEIGKRAYTELGSEELVELLNQDRYVSLLNEPLFLTFMNTIGTKMLDDTLVKGEQAGEKKDEFVPANINSPEMYENSDTEYGAKARAWFRANKGFIYSRND